MNVYIEKDFEFQAGICFQSEFMLGLYKSTLLMTVNTTSIREQNIAMERIKYFINDVLKNIFFIPDYQIDIKRSMKQLGFNICCITDEPYDQLISVILLLKLNAITEGRIRIDSIKISSSLSDNVTFFTTLEEAQEALPSKDWWNDFGRNITACVTKNSNVFTLQPNEDWDSINLGWKESAASSDNNVTSILDKI